MTALKCISLFGLLSHFSAVDMRKQGLLAICLSICQIVPARRDRCKLGYLRQHMVLEYVRVKYQRLVGLVHVSDCQDTQSVPPALPGNTSLVRT